MTPPVLRGANRGRFPSSGSGYPPRADRTAAPRTGPAGAAAREASRSPSSVVRGRFRRRAAGTHRGHGAPRLRQSPQRPVTHPAPGFRSRRAHPPPFPTPLGSRGTVRRRSPRRTPGSLMHAKEVFTTETSGLSRRIGADSEFATLVKKPVRPPSRASVSRDLRDHCTPDRQLGRGSARWQRRWLRLRRRCSLAGVVQ